MASYLISIFFTGFGDFWGAVLVTDAVNYYDPCVRSFFVLQTMELDLERNYKKNAERRLKQLPRDVWLKKGRT